MSTIVVNIITIVTVGNIYKEKKKKLLDYIGISYIVLAVLHQLYMHTAHNPALIK